MYGGRARERTERLVDPWGLADKDAVWYLIAGTAAGQRTFRLDRVVEAELSGATFARPADFDLARGWTRIVDESVVDGLPRRLDPRSQDRVGRAADLHASAPAASRIERAFAVVAASGFSP